MDKNYKFKYGVSEWDFTFESGELVNINSVLSESTYMDTGVTKITLKFSEFDEKLIELFKKGVLVKHIKQTFKINVIDGEDTTGVNEFNDLFIRKVIVTSSNQDDIATYKILLSNE